MRDHTNIAARGKEANGDPPSVSKGCDPKRNRFYVLQIKGANLGYDAGKL